MPDYQGNLASSAEVDPAVGKAPVVTNVTEGSDAAVEDMTGKASSIEINGKIASGASVDDGVEYVHGHPVIRNGM